MEDEEVKCISYKENQTSISISLNSKDQSEVYTDLLDWLWKIDEIPAISRCCKGEIENSKINLVIRSDLIDSLIKYLESKPEKKIKVSFEQEKILVVFIIGNGFSHNTVFISKVLSIFKSPIL